MLEIDYWPDLHVEIAEWFMNLDFGNKEDELNKPIFIVFLLVRNRKLTTL